MLDEPLIFFEMLEFSLALDFNHEKKDELVIKDGHMNFEIKDVRTFVGAKKYDESRAFYQELGFSEIIIDPKMSLFKVNEKFGFYLQDYYVKDWVNNSMVFLEVDDVDLCEKELLALGLQDKYKYVRFTEIKTFRHGRQLFMHDPSGVLWHFCQFFDHG